MSSPRLPFDDHPDTNFGSRTADGGSGVPEPIRSTAVWHEYALAVALDGAGKREPRETFMAAVQRWPGEAMLYRIST